MRKLLSILKQFMDNSHDYNLVTATTNRFLEPRRNTCSSRAADDICNTTILPFFETIKEWIQYMPNSNSNKKWKRSSKVIESEKPIESILLDKQKMSYHPNSCQDVHSTRFQESYYNIETIIRDIINHRISCAVNKILSRARWWISVAIVFVYARGMQQL